ncbi:H-NS histone family protein [Massilia niastensis]|uniref:H-NS histone family protein n=1 Tax=Massilia niastensis TaxID=544911 RepID=UPI0003629A1A|nr:H-NS histone family protein [Massilia niastensis]
MAQIDLSNYNLGELKGLQFEIEKEIKIRQQQDVKKAREQILAIAQEVGVSVEDLVLKSKAKAKEGEVVKVRPQYKNPADDAQTWTGRGRKPKWVAEALEGGKSLDDLRI